MAQPIMTAEPKRLLRRTRARGPDPLRAAVDAVYADMPMSTEQVLHPERYLERDPPTWIELDIAPIEALGYSIIFDQVFGEFRCLPACHARMHMQVV